MTTEKHDELQAAFNAFCDERNLYGHAIFCEIDKPILESGGMVTMCPISINVVRSDHQRIAEALGSMKPLFAAQQAIVEAMQEHVGEWEEFTTRMQNNLESACEKN